MLEKTALGNLIKEKRKAKKLTQKELADALGVANTAVFKYEKGLINNIPTETRLRIMSILDIEANDILPDDFIDTYSTRYKIGDKSGSFISSEKLSHSPDDIIAEYGKQQLSKEQQEYDEHIKTEIDKVTDMQLYLEETLSHTVYCSITKKIIAFNMESISQDDLERILGILAKYSIPLFNRERK